MYVALEVIRLRNLSALVAPAVITKPRSGGVAADPLPNAGRG